MYPEKGKVCCCGAFPLAVCKLSWKFASPELYSQMHSLPVEHNGRVFQQFHFSQKNMRSECVCWQNLYAFHYQPAGYFFAFLPLLNFQPRGIFFWNRSLSPIPPLFFPQAHVSMSALSCCLLHPPALEIPQRNRSPLSLSLDGLFEGREKGGNGKGRKKMLFVVSLTPPQLSKSQ